MRVAVVGMGNMGQRHARVLRDLGHEVVTVDTDPARKPDYATLPRADTACIATPPSALFEQAAGAIERGMDVLVEKPMALTAGQAKALGARARLKQRRLAVGYTERHNPVITVLAAQLPRLGRVRHITIQRLGPAPVHPTPVWLDLATHDLDVLRFLGFAPQLLHVAGGEDHLVSTYQHGRATATIEASHLHPAKVRTISVTGTCGMLSADYQAQTLDLFTHDSVSRLPVRQAEPLRLQWDRFPHGATARDGVAALELATELGDRLQVRQAA